MRLWIGETLEVCRGARLAAEQAQQRPALGIREQHSAVPDGDLGGVAVGIGLDRGVLGPAQHDLDGITEPPAALALGVTGAYRLLANDQLPLDDLVAAALTGGIDAE